MRSFICATLFLFASLSFATANDLSESVVLTDDDFEHRTQASTGATTGTWFVKFHAE